MNCRCASSRLSALLDGELTGAECLALRGHLRDCPECSGELEALRMLKARLSALAAPSPPADLSDRLAALLAKAEDHAPQANGWAGRLALAAVAAVAIGLAIVANQSIRPGDPTLAGRPTTFDVDNDEAFVAGGDPLSGQAPVLAVGR